MTKLKPCPFCGRKAAERDIKVPGGNGWVGCQRCRCFIDFVKNGKPRAIAAWNRRADARQHAGVKTGDSPMVCEEIAPTVARLKHRKTAPEILLLTQRPHRSMSNMELGGRNACTLRLKPVQILLPRWPFLWDERGPSGL